MRVWELASELGKKSSELVAELQELGFAVTAAASGLSDEEAEAIRKAYAALEPTAPSDAARAESDAGEGPEAEAASAPDVEAQAVEIVPRGDGDYVLVRKGSISAGGVVVQKGGTIPEGEYRALPVRVQKFFDRV